MDQPKVPVKHEYKKGYYVALMEAWFAWDPDYLDNTKQALSKAGMTGKDIDAKMYHNAAFFKECCPRVVLAPSALYWRVRSVFATYGNKTDSATKKSLFNERAWKKANNVLKEILIGYASDPPGISLYVHQIDRDGKPRKNKYGLPLFHCLRGTNLTEVHHKQMVQSIGSFSSGIEMSDDVRAEHRHRYTHRISEKRRDDFPLLGHYDTWLIDELQILVEKNHNILIYPTNTNTADFGHTPESHVARFLCSRVNLRRQ